MYLIIKEVHGFKYYWSDAKLQWEGLINNGTPVRQCRFDFLMQGFLNKCLANQFSYILNKKTYSYE